jgi:MerR family transcriptional regulator, light-induced transcriptional regulator
MNIQAVARRTGIPSATLRKWEQRYGVLKPERTAGSHRRYTERDVLRVEWLKARLEEGYRIGEAARLLGGYADAPRLDAEGLVEELVAGAVSPDPSRVVSAIDQAFALFPAEHAVTEVIAPALRRIGELWEQGKATVAQEHQLTEVLRGKMRGLLNGARGGPRGRIVLCCAPGERHEAGLLAVAVLLHADGWQIVYLGADTPLEEAASFAEDVDAPILGVSATMPDAAEAAEPLLAKLTASHPGLQILRGGSAWGGTSADEVVELLRSLPV